MHITDTQPRQRTVIGESFLALDRWRHGTASASSRTRLRVYLACDHRQPADRAVRDSTPNGWVVVMDRVRDVLKVHGAASADGEVELRSGDRARPRLPSCSAAVAQSMTRTPLGFSSACGSVGRTVVGV